MPSALPSGAVVNVPRASRLATKLPTAGVASAVVTLTAAMKKATTIAVSFLRFLLMDISPSLFEVARVSHLVTIRSR
jgi:hypothetical protein